MNSDDLVKSAIVAIRKSMPYYHQQIWLSSYIELFNPTSMRGTGRTYVCVAGAIILAMKNPHSYICIIDTVLDNHDYGRRDIREKYYHILSYLPENVRVWFNLIIKDHEIYVCYNPHRDYSTTPIGVEEKKE